MYIYINNSASSKERELRSLGHSAMEDGKSSRRMRTLSVSILPGARLRRRSADTSATTRVAEDDSNIKKLQELLQQSLRREADTLKKLRHLSEMYQELLYRSHSPSTESKWNCADRCEYFQPLQVFSRGSHSCCLSREIRSIIYADSPELTFSPPDTSTLANVRKVPFSCTSRENARVHVSKQSWLRYLTLLFRQMKPTRVLSPQLVVVNGERSPGELHLFSCPFV